MNDNRLIEMLDMLKQDLEEIEKDITHLNNAMTVRERNRKKTVKAIKELEELLSHRSDN